MSLSIIFFYIIFLICELCETRYILLLKTPYMPLGRIELPDYGLGSLTLYHLILFSIRSLGQLMEPVPYYVIDYLVPLG